MMSGESCLRGLKICFRKFFSNSFNGLVLIVHFKDKSKTRTNRRCVLWLWNISFIFFFSPAEVWGFCSQMTGLIHLSQLLWHVPYNKTEFGRSYQTQIIHLVIGDPRRLLYLKVKKFGLLLPSFGGLCVFYLEDRVRRQLAQVCNLFSLSWDECQKLLPAKEEKQVSVWLFSSLAVNSGAGSGAS